MMQPEKDRKGSHGRLTAVAEGPDTEQPAISNKVRSPGGIMPLSPA
jgi:hypothetical protein